MEKVGGTPPIVLEKERGKADEEHFRKEGVFNGDKGPPGRVKKEKALRT